MMPHEWCDHCQDHFDIYHYDANLDHLVGVEYGPTGRGMVAMKIVGQLAADFDPAVQDDYGAHCYFCVADYDSPHDDDCMFIAARKLAGKPVPARVRDTGP